MRRHSEGVKINPDRKLRSVALGSFRNSRPLDAIRPNDWLLGITLDYLLVLHCTVGLGKYYNVARQLVSGSVWFCGQVCKIISGRLHCLFLLLAIYLSINKYMLLQLIINEHCFDNSKKTHQHSWNQNIASRLVKVWINPNPTVSTKDLHLFRSQWDFHFHNYKDEVYIIH